MFFLCKNYDFEDSYLLSQSLKRLSLKPADFHKVPYNTVFKVYDEEELNLKLDSIPAKIVFL